MTKSTIQKKLMKGVHIENRWGSPGAASGYCLKGDKEKPDDGGSDWYKRFHEEPDKEAKIIVRMGELKQPGVKRSLQTASEEVLAGESVDDICVEKYRPQASRCSRAASPMLPARACHAQLALFPPASRCFA